MITPLDHTVRGVMEFTWPMIVICVLLISSIRLFDIFKNKKEFQLHRELLGLLFIIYILCLFQVVTFEDPSGFQSRNNFTPFQEMLRYSFGSRLFFKNVLGNMLMFVPYGFFTALYLKLDKKYQSFLLIAFASVCIETTQLAIGRVFDIDDILLNIVGGMLGYAVYRTAENLEKKLPAQFSSNWFKNGMAIFLFVVLLGYLWKVLSV